MAEQKRSNSNQPSGGSWRWLVTVRFVPAEQRADDGVIMPHRRTRVELFPLVHIENEALGWIAALLLGYPVPRQAEHIAQPRSFPEARGPAIGLPLDVLALILRAVELDQSDGQLLITAE
jgi:hypothetical protein